MKNTSQKKKIKGKTIMPVSLETCGQHGHLGGCYIRFTNNKPVISEERSDVVVDYGRNHKIIGIEFYNGFKLKEIR